MTKRGRHKSHQQQRQALARPPPQIMRCNRCGAMPPPTRLAMTIHATATCPGMYEHGQPWFTQKIMRLMQAATELGRET